MWRLLFMTSLIKGTGSYELYKIQFFTTELLDF